MAVVSLIRLTVLGLAAVCLTTAQGPLFPLNEIRPGQRGVGRTVFTGDRIEEFNVEILGVLENIGPKQSVILARLSGGPLEHTGVMQGMSGSPVYIDGRLAGAVALAFSFSKDPIAGIRPIEEMLRVDQAPANPSRRLAETRPASAVTWGETKLTEIATPVSFAGFTQRTLDHFGEQLRKLGLEPRQGTSGAGKVRTPGNPAALKPGSMISVQLLSGDMAVGADGTVTHIDGNRLYAFGHRFLSVGETELPFARSEVLTLLPNVSTSFKISSAREWMGSITQDRNAAISGELGRKANLAPITITVNNGKAGPLQRYQMAMVNDRFLTPLLVQMAVFSAIDATERTLGSSTFALKGSIEFEGATAPVRLDNVYAGDFNVPLQVSAGAASPLAYALQSGFSSLKLKNVSIALEAFDSKKQLTIENVWTSKRQVRPGEPVDITTVLQGENGAEVTKTVSWQVPIGAPAGPLFVTVADGVTTNLTEYRQFLTGKPHSPEQLVSFLNRLRGNAGAYVRVWRAQNGYQVEGEELPAPPPSVALVLGRQQTATASVGSKIAEIAFTTGDFVVSGSKTIQVEVKD
ncbi:MAG: SpoIVB peptidase S55 domain-containing protein [Bryobacteraceae bacterium]|nr:SpoIVB peptidase S55 domain-containing protein [Bryobacteraceae bacterium]